MSVNKLLGGQLTVEPKPEYVHVWHSRPAQSVAELKLVLIALDSALRRSKQKRILFDSRDSAGTPDEVQGLFWAWLQDSKLDKIATLVDSKNLAVSARMTGLSRGINLRAFDDAASAVKWVSA